MDAGKVYSLLDALDENIDEMKDAFAPILQENLSITASKLPLIDKAQLHVLIAYAIESILFSFLRVNGVKAKEHPVFRELSRVKQYLAKIKAAESANAKPTLNLDKAAANRFIKHALASNQENPQQASKDVVDSAVNGELAKSKKRKSDLKADTDSQRSSSTKKRSKKDEKIIGR